MEFTDGDKQVLANVHTVFYKAKLIDSPELANLGLQFTQLMQRITAPAAKEPMLRNADDLKKESKKANG